MGKIFAIVNQKGGVGKTTTAINLGYSLSYLNRKILIVDLDYQANATTCLGINRGTVEKNIFDCMVEDEHIKDVIIKTKSENVDLAPAKTLLEGIEERMVQNPNRDFILHNQLYDIKDKYDYILIDCPPALGIMTMNALCAADSIIIPVQCEFLAMDGLTQLLNSIRNAQMKKKVNREDLTIYGVLITMMDSRIITSQQVTTEIKTYFEEKIFKTVIPRNISCSNATMYGVPVTEFSPKSKGSISYKQLAKEVIARDEGK